MTRKDVARAAGVSTGTVSNVLNAPDLVADSTRIRVETIIDKLGYVRNESARQLRSGASRTVALVGLDAANPYFAELLRGIDDRASTHGQVSVMCESLNDPIREQALITTFEEQRVRGLVLVPVSEPRPEVERLHRHRIPTVVIYRPEADYVCSAMIDDRAGGALAITHLIAASRRNIAFLGGPSSLQAVGDRLAGVMSIATRESVRVHVFDTPSLGVEDGYWGVQPVVDPMGPPIDAIVAANDLLAVGAMKRLRDEGLNVPRDVAVIGYDDSPIASSALVPLTTIRQPARKLGNVAWDLLEREYQDYSQSAVHRHRHILLAPTLVKRESA